jgi:hypothetical protein
MFRHSRILTLAVSLCVPWTQPCKADQQSGGQQSGGQQSGGQQSGGQQTGRQQTGGQQTWGQQTGRQQTGRQHIGPQQTQFQQQPTQQTPSQQRPTQHVTLSDSQPPSYLPGWPHRTSTYYLPHWYYGSGGSQSTLLFPVRQHQSTQPPYRDEQGGYVILISPTSSEVPAVFSNSDPNAEARARRLEHLLRTKYKGVIGNIKVEPGSHGGQSLSGTRDPGATDGFAPSILGGGSPGFGSWVVWYRVLKPFTYGHYATRAEAEAALRKLGFLGFTGTVEPASSQHRSLDILAS